MVLEGMGGRLAMGIRLAFGKTNGWIVGLARFAHLVSQSSLLWISTIVPPGPPNGWDMNCSGGSRLQGRIQLLRLMLLFRISCLKFLIRCGELSGNGKGHIEFVTSYGCVKLNSDGAAQGNPGSAGASSLIRDEFGNWFSGLLLIMPLSDTAEPWGVISGHRLAWSLGYRKVILKVDSLLVRDWIMENADCDPATVFFSISFGHCPLRTRLFG
ncbi:hypothetical protein CRG98_021623 [Punica granatum]|uniref:RNase H type-1 domain-containing protein n=1 Tax=Punica granatum TaxID=22663 RepID=A0A2I0JNZ5_PUNGR|nr:hypothetical protein CRG98_021623 [Punica granatum]